MKRYSKGYIYAKSRFFRIRQEYGNFRLPDSLYRLHADPRRGALPDLIWPYKWVCTAEQGIVFFHNLES